MTGHDMGTGLLGPGLVFVALFLLAPTTGLAADYKVYPGVACQPLATNANWKYEDGGIFNTETCSEGNCMTVMCPIHRDRLWQSSWTEIEIYVSDRSADHDIECTVEILKVDYSNFFEVKSSSGTGYTSIKFSEIQNSDAGTKASYGFMCTFPSGSNSNPTGILGYRVKE